tara:strand:- start:326 stop:1357 length:1032 start_codon:yes stop_codon:yes gene_type:complete
MNPVAWKHILMSQELWDLRRQAKQAVWDGVRVLPENSGLVGHFYQAPSFCQTKADETTIWPEGFDPTFAGVRFAEGGQAPTTSQAPTTTTTTTQPPATTTTTVAPVSDVVLIGGSGEPDPGPYTVVRGEELKIRWTVTTEGLSYNRIYGYGTNSDPGQYDLANECCRLRGELVSTSDTRGSYEATLDTNGMPLGDSTYLVEAIRTDGTNSSSSLTVTVVPPVEPPERTGPVIEFLSVSQPTLSAGDVITVRWNVSDPSGVESVSWGSGHATVFKASCSKRSTYLKHGPLVSGTVYDGVFEATWVAEQYHANDGPGFCDLQFSATDIWGNWTHYEFDNALVVSG